MRPLLIQILFALLLAGSFFFTPVLALFSGILFALFLPNPFPRISKKTSTYLLQIAVVGLGFGMNLFESLKTGKEGMLSTLVSVSGILLIGYFLARKFKIGKKLSYLIAAGTAICGGSAIATLAPVVKASEEEKSMSLAIIFSLNALALLLFPGIGHLLGLSQHEFGTWAALGIHDTSSVVGAGAAYGKEALGLATTIKLTRALWIIPLSFLSSFLFREEKSKKFSIPWFILLFLIAMLANTYLNIPETLLGGIRFMAHKFLSISLFLTGTLLSVQSIKKIGVRPLLLGICLWVLISTISLGLIMATSQ